MALNFLHFSKPTLKKILVLVEDGLGALFFELFGYEENVLILVFVEDGL